MNDAKPNAFLRAISVIGPGIVVAGSVIGGGELINTPLQAATFGFVLLWVVLLSCVIKYFLQVEIARHCLAHNRTTIQALNEVPGPRFRGTSWVVLLYIPGFFAANLTIVGIYGALGGLMHGVRPLAASEVTSARYWAVVMAVLAVALLWQGWYRQLEVAVMVMVGVFSIAVAVGVLLIQGTSFAMTWSEVTSGLTFSIGPNREAAAFAVISLMGALGVAANELFMYPYWILEKGYAKELGEPASAGWVERTKRAIRWIWLDAGFSTTLATLVTAAFFLLGAAVLHRQQIMPNGVKVVDQISAVFTESYGEWSKAIFYAGAFCTLFSTLVVVAAASGRMGADLLNSLGLIDARDPQTARRYHQILQNLFLVGELALFLVLQAHPERYIVWGHFVLGAYLGPLLMLCICWLAFNTDRRVRMSWPTAIALIGSVAIILGCVGINAAVKLWPLVRS
jgi:manganese transport protein